MNQVKLFFGKYWHTILALSVVLLIFYLVYRAGKKSNNVTVTSDSGIVTQADHDKANALAERLKNDLSGISTGHDDTVYLELAQSSNTVFALTFGKYRTLAGSSLIADINSDYFWGWDVIDVIVNRATQLNLT